MAVSLVHPRRVSLVKHNPAVRATRLRLRSTALQYVDVIERADGSVEYAGRRHPHFLILGQPPVHVQPVRFGFDRAFRDRYDFEQSVGCLWSARTLSV